MSAPAHTLVYTHGGGRLGNQVLRFLHLLAWQRENADRCGLVNLAFWPLARHFAAWSDAPACAVPEAPWTVRTAARAIFGLPAWLRHPIEKHARLPRAVQAVAAGLSDCQVIALDVAQHEAIDLEAPAFLERVGARRVTVCSGWRIAGWNLVARHQAALRPWFQPAPAVRQVARDFIGALRAQHDLVAGLFIRHGDYREWHDGDFWFPVETYAGWVRQFLDLHPNRRIAVVVASDERQPPEAFAGLPVHFATGSVNAGGPWIESFAELALCEVILSPPSTFAATAAFVGGVPLWPLTAAAQALAPGQLLADALIEAARHPLFSEAVR